jgi:tRNA (Thr-GGU) A37 N-methylase
MIDPTTENYVWNQEMIIHPVGFVQSELKDPSLATGREGLQSSGEAGDVLQEAQRIRELVSHILVNPALDGILDGLTAFSHALILYWPHPDPRPPNGPEGSPRGGRVRHVQSGPAQSHPGHGG